MINVVIKNTSLKDFPSGNNNKLTSIIQTAFRGMSKDVHLFSVGAAHTHKFTAKKDLYIFNYSTMRKTDESSAPLVVNDVLDVFGVGLAVEKMFPPAEGGVLIGDENGVVVAQYFPEHRVLNIFVDLLTNQTAGTLHVFKRIMAEVAKIIAEEGDMDSWKRAKDKTHIINKTRDMIRNQHNQRVSQARDQANNSQEKIETYRRELTSHHRKLADAMKLIEDSEGAFDEKANKLIADMELLAQFDRVTDLRVEGEWIHIHTDRIIITDPESGNQYIGGEFIIKVRMQDSKVTFHSANGSGHRGYWTSNDPHPHVNGSDGVACLGSVSSTIAELCSQEQIYALGIVLISFLEAVNVNDSAGRKVENWRRYHGEGTDTSTEAESLFDTDDEEESAE
jgi:hypothetical protein